MFLVTLTQNPWNIQFSIELKMLMVDLKSVLEDLKSNEKNDMPTKSCSCDEVCVFSKFEPNLKQILWQIATLASLVQAF